MNSLWDTVFPYLAALLPTIGVAFLFYFIMKFILEGDRRERLAQARWEASERSAQAQSAHDGAEEAPPEVAPR